MKGLVKRGVIELVTPGVVMGDNILSGKENTYLASVYFGKQTTGVAFLDISTGEFYVAEGTDRYVDKLISNLAPKEVIYQRGCDERFRQEPSARAVHLPARRVGLRRRRSTARSSASTSAPARSRGSASTTSPAASRPPEPSSTIWSSPSTATSRTSTPSPASTRTTTYGSTSSPSATWNSSPRTARATAAASPT